MMKKLLEQAFEKIGRQTGNKTDNGRASHLEYELRENFGISVSAKTLVRYLKNESSPKSDVLNKLAEFLNYSNYEDFVAKQIGISKGDGVRAENVKESLIRPGYKKVGIFIMALIVGNLMYLGFMKEKQECMVWVDDHYERSFCNGESWEIPLDETRLEKFKKIVVCDTTTFFHNYDPIIWYDKTNNRLEYFTYYGLHPVTGKTLKPITQTIIENHVLACTGSKDTVLLQ